MAIGASYRAAAIKRSYKQRNGNIIRRKRSSVARKYSGGENQLWRGQL